MLHTGMLDRLKDCLLHPICHALLDLGKLSLQGTTSISMQQHRAEAAYLPDRICIAA